MALESATYISQLNPTYPQGSEAKSVLDDHQRLVKQVLQNSFPGVSGAVTATHTELNYVDGVTSNVQTQIDAISSNKANLASPTFTGTPAAPTATAGTSTTQLATTQFVANAVSSISPTTSLTVQVVTGTSQTAVAGSHYVMTNVAASSLALPASPSSGDTVAVTFTNGLATNSIARNGKTIMALSEDMTVDLTAGLTVTLRYLNSDWRLV